MDVWVAMVNQSWRDFLDEIARWREAGLTVDFWWRDDDATRLDPALTRLVALADVARIPLALAVIPQEAVAAAFERPSRMVTLLQHGVDHRNRAAFGEKKTEFPAAEPITSALERLMAGRARLMQVGGAAVLPVLVPPWNRISSAHLIASLTDAGYLGLSTYGPRRAPDAAPGLRLINTHVDVIDWRGSRGFVGEEVALAQAIQHLCERRTGVVDAAECTGWLTHHAVHDEPAWTFMARLFERTQGENTVRWRSAADLFGCGSG